MNFKLISLFSILFFNLPSNAAEGPTNVTAELKSVTVYRGGAEMVHGVKQNLKQGTNDLLITRVSNQLELSSIRITGAEKLSILSVEFSADYLIPHTQNAAEKKLKDSLDNLSDEIERNRVLLTTDKELMDVLKANKQMAGTQTGLSIAELMKMMDYYRTKTLELQSEISKTNDKNKKLEEQRSRIANQLAEEERKGQVPGGRLRLQVLAPVPGNYDFTISYLTAHAGWVPSYDLKVESISKPLKLIQKARIIQTTGFDWSQVKLNLSTSYPSQHGDAPIFKTWFLAYIDPMQRLRNSNGYINTVPGMAASKQLNETSTTGNSMRLDDGDLGDHVTVRDNEMDVVFDIDLPYDIPANGKDQHVVLKETNVSSVYTYYAAPKLDKDAYLLGEIANWEDLHLLAGEANIIFEGTYLGKTAIDPKSVLDTLTLSLGKDKRVVVKREKLKDFSSEKFLGASKKQTIAYEITVKNNKKEKIQMLLKDQYPISTDKDIEVELLESSGAVINKESGVLTWKLELAPGESKKYRISYSVRYPKDKVVNL